MVMTPFRMEVTSGGRGGGVIGKKHTGSSNCTDNT